MTITIQDELTRKALDQMAHLLASQEAGKISLSTFKVGVETIWACLSGVVDTQEFSEIISEANAYIRELENK